MNLGPTSTPDGSLFSFHTPQSRVAGVPARWRRQYGNEPVQADKAAILAKLEATDLTRATPDDIAAIIGNRSWTDEVCSVCEDDCDDGWLEFATWESPQTICRGCVALAHAILGAVK